MRETVSGRSSITVSQPSCLLWCFCISERRGPDPGAAVPWAADSQRGPTLIGALNSDLQEQRDPVSLRDVPKHLVDAVLAVEDQRFYRHNGLDLKRILGAFVADVKARGAAEGGSTITQ